MSRADHRPRWRDDRRLRDQRGPGFVERLGSSQPRRQSHHRHRSGHDRRHLCVHLRELDSNRSGRRRRPGTLFYWKSTVAALGLSGQVWSKKFGDTAHAEADISSPVFKQPLCTGCHTLTRDGMRMLAYPADDTDPDYPGLQGSLVDMSGFPSNPAVILAAASPRDGARSRRPQLRTSHRTGCRAAPKATILSAIGRCHVPVRRRRERVLALGQRQRCFRRVDLHGIRQRAADDAIFVGGWHFGCVRLTGCDWELGRIESQRRRPRLRRQPLSRSLGQRRPFVRDKPCRFAGRKQLLSLLLARLPAVVRAVRPGPPRRERRLADRLPWDCSQSDLPER